MSKTFPSTASSETGDSRRIRGVNAVNGRQFSSTRSTFSRGQAAMDSLSRLIYTTSITWAVRLSWLENAYSHLLFSAGNCDP